MELPPDLRFGAALAILGVVMLIVHPQVAAWLGVLLVLAALTYAEKDARKTGHSFIGDLRHLFGGATG
jgi:hypothetical protein